jgi:uncharacterized phage protein gp47/JayE
MPYNKPSLTEIIDRVTSDLSRGLTGVDGSVIRRSLLKILARADAGVVFLLYGYIDWVSKQIIPDTAEKEFLERWAAIFQVTRKPATYTRRQVIFTGTNDVAIPLNTVIQRPDGFEYVVVTGGVVASGTVTVTVQSTLPGAESVVDTGIVMTLASPINGINANGTVGGSGKVDGVDEETDDDLRSRLVKRIQEPPQGGSESDYERWALEVPGVTRAWVYPLEDGGGTVAIRFVCDNDPDTIIPTVEKIEEVQTYIDAPDRRPVTANVTVKALVGKALDITTLLSPNNADTQAAVTAEYNDLIRRESEPGGTILKSHIREAASIAQGEDDNSVTVPVGNFTTDPNEIAVPGDYTYQAFP